MPLRDSRGKGQRLPNVFYLEVREIRQSVFCRPPGSQCFDDHSNRYSQSSDGRLPADDLGFHRNDRAVRLWQKFGFETAGRLPGAFRHPTDGCLDAYAMYRAL